MMRTDILVRFFLGAEAREIVMARLLWMPAKGDVFRVKGINRLATSVVTVVDIDDGVWVEVRLVA